MGGLLRRCHSENHIVVQFTQAWPISRISIIRVIWAICLKALRMKMSRADNRWHDSGRSLATDDNESSDQDA